MVELETLLGKKKSFPNYIDKQEVTNLENIAFSGKIHLIDTPEKAAEAFAVLGKLSFVGFDTETRPSFKRGESFPVSLIQISDGKECWIFQLGKIGFDPFWVDFFQNKEILKIGLAIQDDFKDLKSFKPFQQKGVVDLNKIGPKLGFRCNGLRRLSAILLNKKVSKTFQVSKWDQELSDGQILYAATDAYVPILLWRELLENFDLKELNHGV